MNAALIDNPQRSAEILARIPAGRWGRPDDMLGTAIFLASKASDYIHGAIIPVGSAFQEWRAGHYTGEQLSEARLLRQDPCTRRERRLRGRTD